MKTPLVTRNEIAEAIALHTACMPTREIPGAIANYFMITRRFYTRTDKAVINRLLIAEIRDYLIEQGRLRYATVAAEMRKEAHRMTGNNLNVEKNSTCCFSYAITSCECYLQHWRHNRQPDTVKDGQ
ncbi:putative antirepressor [Escherichia coli]|nr:putative antirepressor [Escherichia coli]